MPSCARSRTNSSTASTSAMRQCKWRPETSTIANCTRRTGPEDITMTETTRQGGCGCGHVRYQVEGEPIFVNNCHCRLCQQQTGSTSVVNAFFETERVTLLQGELRDHTVTAGGGGPHLIRRCAECGAALWSIYPRLGKLGTGLRVGTMDDPGAWRPDAVIFTESKM